MLQSQASIQIRELGKSFGEKTVLKNLTLEIKTGELVALTGENGSGKTTLLKILSTLLTPTEGEVWIEGRSVRSEPEKVRRGLGWMPSSDRGFVPRFTGQENLEFFAALRGLAKSQVTAYLDAHRSFTTLQSALQTPFYLCSTGMKQSLHFARATLAQPAFLFLDEPMRSLDSHSAEFLKKFLREKSPQTTVVFSTHTLEGWRDFPGREIELKNRAASL
jgi:ABC-type multidrug transport system ATPase subunit